MDYLGPLPRSDKKAYISVATKACRCGVVRCYVMTAEIQTYQGIRFVANSPKQLYTALEINTGPPPHIGQEMTQQYKVTLFKMLRRYVSVNQNYCHKYVQLTTLAYYSASHASMEYSPFDVLHELSRINQ